MSRTHHSAFEPPKKVPEQRVQRYAWKPKSGFGHITCTGKHVVFCSTCSEGLVSRPQPSIVSLSTASATAATWPAAAIDKIARL